VYFKGTWLGELATLVQLNDGYGLEKERDQAVDVLYRVLHESLVDFRYDEEKRMFISMKPEFGNEKGNDHHFHYGYYIRAAATLQRYRPLDTGDTQVITEMIADIASSDRSSTRYPFLRVYSPYEGHSWADGEARFADGNDQESTSEALNAWYALHMWGGVVHDTELQRRAAWLFSQELSGTYAYWYGVNNPFPSQYTYPLASLVWGGKREFGTWFSAQPLHVAGIQWLPITPASAYLRDTPGSRVIAALDTLDSRAVHHEWGDLYLIYLGYFDSKKSEKMLSLLDKPNGAKLKSLVYHNIYKDIEK
jgi:endoglucanase Acf2